MARGKSVTKTLLNASQAAFFAGIEIHNKPQIPYRYPTAVILIINAWELALKAYLYKYIGKKAIYEKDKTHTIKFPNALNLVYKHIKDQEGNQKFYADVQNLEKLNTYRCDFVHFADGALDPIIFMLMCRAVLNYNSFMQKYFSRDVTKSDNLVILPIALKLPFNPIEYLKQEYGRAHNDYVNDVVNTIRELDAQGIEESIVIGFSLTTQSIREVKNADIVAAIGEDPNAVALRRGIRITDDPNAQVCRIEPDLPPLSYQDLVKKAKERNPDIKLNKRFHDAKKEIAKNPKFCIRRYLDPSKKNGAKKEFYSLEAVDALLEAYEKLGCEQ